MNKTILLAAFAALLLVLPVLFTASEAEASGNQHAFGFNSANISGFATGSARLTGGGAYNLISGFVKSAGGFRCTDNVDQGPLSGCKTGQGVRWDTEELLSTLPAPGFKCTGTAGEANKNVFTSADTVVMTADFYRAGDGNDESFTANLIISSEDIAPDIEGFQNVWIQGVGCGHAIVTFSK